MKKYILILITLIPLLSTSQDDIQFDQWINIETKDSFGDDTNEKSLMFFTKGVFSNSATSNSELLVRITDFKKQFHINLFEYGKPPAARLNGLSPLIQIKNENGEVISGSALLVDDIHLYITKKSKLGKLMSNGTGEILKVLITEQSEYSKSEYLFSIKSK
jgi:hypothetical protein